ncbi:MAG: DMT family transporter [Chloroflexi bacterium]|nr:DMT family transporter [Chloroflexota bacterium]
MLRLVIILVTGLALGSSVVMLRLGLTEISPLVQVALRLVVSTAAFVLTMILLRRKWPRERDRLLDIGLVGITNTAVPIIAFTIAAQFISSAVLAIYLATIPLFTAVLAHLWLAQERLTGIKLAGLLLAFAGVIFLLITRTTGLVGSGAAGDVRAQVLVLGGVVAIAVASVYTRRRLQGVDALTVSALQTIVAGIVVVPVALSLDPVNLMAIGLRGWLSVLYTGIVGSFFGFFLLFYMIRRYGATTSTLPSYVMPAVSAYLGVLVLGEIVTPSLLGGAGLILAGVFLASR